MRDALFRTYHKLERVLAPGLEYSQHLYEPVLDDIVKPDTVWLDLGCGHQLLPEWRADRETRIVGRCRNVVGLDYDTASLKKHKTIRRLVRGAASHLPHPDETFDLVTANMVVEHLDDPAAQFREVRRVLPFLFQYFSSHTKTFQ